MSEYDVIKKGKLVLKGEKPSSKRKKKHKHTDKKLKAEPVEDRDKIVHGGWCKLESLREINGSVAIEFGERTYVAALDNGLFTLGPPHNEGEGPAPEEVLTAIPVGEARVAFKSGYGKYVGIDKDGTVVGRSDAIGPLEQWEPVFQDGKSALLSNTGCFMSVRESDDSIVAVSRSAKEREMVQIRRAEVGDAPGAVGTDDFTNPPEESGSLAQIELNYVKKFQKFQDKKIKVNTEARTDLKKAKGKGKLHEALLDRRSKMKADRYCKI